MYLKLTHNNLPVLLVRRHLIRRPHFTVGGASSDERYDAGTGLSRDGVLLVFVPASVPSTKDI